MTVKNKHQIQCKDCDKRKVGCHATCQTYIINRVIHTYKKQKEFDAHMATMNSVRIDYTHRKRARQLNGGYC